MRSAAASNRSTSASVDLGVLRMGLVSNKPLDAALAFFPCYSNYAEDRDDVIVELYEMPIRTQAESVTPDSSYRAKRMLSGYYITDHFGPPVRMSYRHDRLRFEGSDLQNVLWAYAVKLILTVEAARKGALHLKAAALRHEGRGVLLLGRGGAGKTTFLTQSCVNEGSEFIANTHVYIEDGNPHLITGVPSNMRVRRSGLFTAAIDSGSLPQSIKDGEYTVNPYEFFPEISSAPSPADVVCFLQWQKGRTPEIHTVDLPFAVQIAEQFALPINVYGLKEDILDCVGGEFSEFCEVYGRMKSMLTEMLRRSTCMYIKADMDDEECRKKVMRAISDAPSVV